MSLPSPGVAEFVREICDVSRGEPQVVIHMLDCDDEVIAMFTGVEDGARFSMMFNTYTLSENARYSPGLILIRHIIDHYASRGFTSLDLGVGGDHYKTIFCKDSEELFDSFIPLTARGWPMATALSLAARAKHAVKRSSMLLRSRQKRSAPAARRESYAAAIRGLSSAAGGDHCHAGKARIHQLRARLLDLAGRLCRIADQHDMGFHPGKDVRQGRDGARFHHHMIVNAAERIERHADAGRLQGRVVGAMLAGADDMQVGQAVVNNDVSERGFASDKLRKAGGAGIGRSRGQDRRRPGEVGQHDAAIARQPTCQRQRSRRGTAARVVPMTAMRFVPSLRRLTAASAMSRSGEAASGRTSAAMRGSTCRDAGAGGAPMRSSSPVIASPLHNRNVASVAISTIGSFFG